MIDCCESCLRRAFLLAHLAPRIAGLLGKRRPRAGGLLALGLEPEQRVGIASSTRYEWILADLAIMCAGGATTTVYPSTNTEDTAYILSDSESQVVFAEDDEQVAKLLVSFVIVRRGGKLVRLFDHLFQHAIDGGPVVAQRRGALLHLLRVGERGQRS